MQGQALSGPFAQLLRYTAPADARSTTPMPSIWDSAQPELQAYLWHELH